MTGTNEDHSSLDNLLDGTQPQAPAPQPEPEASEPDTQGDKDASAPPVDAKSEDGPLVPRKALEDERRKRQDYEKRLAEHERQLAELRAARAAPQAQPQPQRPAPDWWTSPEEAAAMMQQEQQYAIYETRVALSEEMMSTKPDYAEMRDVFVQAARQYPDLATQLARHPMPAKFAYEMGRRLKAQSEIGEDPEAWKERERERIRQEFASNTQQPQIASPAPKAPAPKSLAGMTSASQPRDPKGRFANDGPRSLEDLIG